MRAGHFILAYHGCDVTLRDDLVSGRISHLDHSDNKYDWLGPGAYFFENENEQIPVNTKADDSDGDVIFRALPSR
ncbi:MAG: hypothetical protein JWM42_36 [Burkholderia sp.]|nr:hypothetical protein [Burkholderia sp.]